MVDDIVWDITPKEGETYEAARKRLNLPTYEALPSSLRLPLPHRMKAIQDEEWPPGYRMVIEEWLNDKYGHKVKRFTMC